MKGILYQSPNNLDSHDYRRIERFHLPDSIDNDIIIEITPILYNDEIISVERS